MSYTPQEAKGERDQEVAEAIETRDSEALYNLAGMYKEEGEDEMAEVLRTKARKIDREDSQEDQTRADKEERATERYESYRDNNNDAY